MAYLPYVDRSYHLSTLHVLEITGYRLPKPEHLQCILLGCNFTLTGIEPAYYYQYPSRFFRYLRCDRCDRMLLADYLDEKNSLAKSSLYWEQVSSYRWYA